VFEFEKVASALQLKTHETVLEINLSNLVHNLNYYKSKLPPKVKMMAMVKAFSYGSGSTEVATALQFSGVDYLAVAYADEGMELRRAGVNLPIMVMNPDAESIISMIESRLEPEIYSFRILHQFIDALQKRSGFDTEQLNIHIKLDTGMHRLGFEEHDLLELTRQLNLHPQIGIASVFSHLAASSDPEHDEFTQSQIAKFKRFSEVIENNTGKDFLRHILNSGGISRHPNACFDMVRLGIGMYGIGEFDEQAQLLPVGKLSTTISQIRIVKAGETIGYSRRAKTIEDTRVATIPIGYADGFSRKLGQGKFSVMIHGSLAPTIGSICMDMCMIDITAIPEAREGDQVIIFQSDLEIRQMADAAETIPYEVLTSISPRVKRVYFQE
jgi:alanine racemase